MCNHGGGIPSNARFVEEIEDVQQTNAKTLVAQIQYLMNIFTHALVMGMHWKEFHVYACTAHSSQYFIYSFFFCDETSFTHFVAPLLTH